MMPAIIKETREGGGGASPTALRLITRCLEVTPVCTLTHKTFTLLSPREKEANGTYIRFDRF